jgi:hypothetical protein
MDDAADRAYFRSQIRPFPREAHYLTGWNGTLTFAEIRDALTPNLNRLMRYYHYVEVDIPDMIAHGFMRLWEELSKTPNFLATFDQGDALAWITYRSGTPHYRKFYRREMYLEDLAARSGHPEEFVIDGFDHSPTHSHAAYAEAVDLRLDIEQAMRQMAEKYMDSLPHLAALYYITTSVTPDDAAELAGRGGTKKCWWLTNVVKPMREELGDLLGQEHHAKQTWQDKLRAGQETPFLQLVEHFAATGNERMTVALRGLAEHESTKSMMAKLDLPKSHVQYLRLRAHKELNQAYGCRSA